MAVQIAVALGARVFGVASARNLEYVRSLGASEVFDYGQLGCLLERGFVRHGGIRRQDLLGWYRHRGREKRYQAADLRRLFGTRRWAELAIHPEAPGSDRIRLEARRTVR